MSTNLVNDEDFSPTPEPTEPQTYAVVPSEQLILKVANGTDIHKLATSVRRHVESERYQRVVLSCIGVQTVNQAIKAVAVANERSAPQGYLLFLYPYFHIEKKDDHVEHTIVRFSVIRHLIGS